MKWKLSVAGNGTTSFFGGRGEAVRLQIPQQWEKWKYVTGGRKCVEGFGKIWKNRVVFRRNESNEGRNFELKNIYESETQSGRWVHLRETWSNGNERKYNGQRQIEMYLLRIIPIWNNVLWTKTSVYHVWIKVDEPLLTDNTITTIKHLW